MKLPDSITADPDLRKVLGVIEAAGHRAFVVGGAVRNALLGVPVSDIDIATDARPEQVQALALAAGMKQAPTGIAHGTVTVIAGGRPFEVTTFRRDVETFGRRAVVAFSDRIEEDAARRDFTVNALYATAAGEIIDPVDGLADLAARRIRFVGEPQARITEDYLRILRFFRFHAWYGAPGAVDAPALDACTRLAGGVASLSRERIGAEIVKLLGAPDPVEAVTLMEQAGVLAQALPGAHGAALPALVAAEREASCTPGAIRRLAALGGTDPAVALRLSRADARALAAITAAQDGFTVEAAGYRLGANLGRNAALLAIARGHALPADWQDRLTRAAASPLPLRAGDLPAAFSGPQIGRALKAAEEEWIASGFSASPAALGRRALATAAREGGR